MPFGNPTDATPQYPEGKPVTPVSTRARMALAVSDLKATAITLAELRNPTVLAAKSHISPVLLRHAARFSIYGRTRALAGVTVTQQAQVALVLVDGEYDNGNKLFTKVNALARVDDVSATNMTVASGIPLNFVTSDPLSAGMINDGSGYLWTPALGAGYYDTRSFSHLLVLPLVAQTGASATAVPGANTTEQHEIWVAASN